MQNNSGRQPWIRNAALCSKCGLMMLLPPMTYLPLLWAMTLSHAASSLKNMRSRSRTSTSKSIRLLTCSSSQTACRSLLANLIAESIPSGNR